MFQYCAAQRHVSAAAQEQLSALLHGEYAEKMYLSTEEDHAQGRSSQTGSQAVEQHNAPSQNKAASANLGSTAQQSRKYYQ